MKYAESCGLSDEQWGFHSNRTSTDGAARKMLTFEYGRYMKVTIVLFANGQPACFDRMIPAFTNIIAQAHGVNDKSLQYQAKTIKSMEPYIKTGLGVSRRAYKNQPGRPLSI